MDLDSGARQKRTLAERRESDKLRQRRFRAKKREEARLLQAITGVVEVKKKERVNTIPKKTAEEIRETNRIRQQRFRAKRRDEGSVMDTILDVKTEDPLPPTLVPQLPISDHPVDYVQRILIQAANEEKSRQTEIRREKDRIRKRRERQRKRDNAEQMSKIQSQRKDEPSPSRDPEDKEYKKPNYEDMEDDPEDPSIPEVQDSEYFDAQHFMAQLEEMGLVLGVSDSNEGSLEIKQKTPESQESTSSSPDPTPSPSVLDMFTLEKKPWQRCNSAEERRERERMRKRMYRAKQKYISTGKLEMQWDPSPIKRSPNDDNDDGITPIPEWNTSLSAEQRMMAHRIYNKRYRERLKCSAMKEEASRSQETSDSVQCS